jgi:hypothetical protein
MDDFEFLRFFFCNRSGNFFSSGRIASPISDAIRHPEGWHPLLFFCKFPKQTQVCESKILLLKKLGG